MAIARPITMWPHGAIKALRKATTIVSRSRMMAFAPHHHVAAQRTYSTACAQKAVWWQSRPITTWSHRGTTGGHKRLFWYDTFGVGNLKLMLYREKHQSHPKSPSTDPPHPYPSSEGWAITERCKEVNPRAHRYAQGAGLGFKSCQIMHDELVCLITRVRAELALLKTVKLQCESKLSERWYVSIRPQPER
jgi:hypothetical protein